MENKQRNIHLDLMKLFFSLIICTLHYNWRIVPQGYLCVEFFFISTGYLIYKRRQHYYDKDLLTLILRKLKSFYFYYLFLVILDGILRFAQGNQISVSDIVASLFFLPYICGGISFNVWANLVSPCLFSSSNFYNIIS